MMPIKLPKLNSGLFTKLIVLVVIVGCNKEKKNTTCRHDPLVLQDSMCNLSGNRHWHGTHYRWLYPVTDTTIYISDTSYPITIIDSRKIVIWNEILICNADSSTSDLLYFKGVNGSNTSILKYRCKVDSIAFCHSHHEMITRDYFDLYTP